MKERNHFMPIELITSQFETLEPPSVAENPILVDINLPVDVLVKQIALEVINRQPSLNN
jgi:gluconate kinase